MTGFNFEKLLISQVQHITVTLAGGKWSTLYFGERVPSTHCIGGWVSPRAGLEDRDEKKILNPTGTRNVAIFKVRRE
jgi:hypothetical protein